MTQGRGRQPPVVDFEEWYAREFGRVYALVVLAVGDAGLAEEATAEAFARALARWGTVRTADSPTAWVYTVALNQVRSTFRRRRLERRWLAQQSVRHADPPPEPDDDLQRALAGLTERARLAVLLRYFDDLPEKDVAAVMGISRGAVATLLHRARSKLAALLATDTHQMREAKEVSGESVH